MMNLDGLRRERRLVNAIDWGMTPEKAVDMYLEWGAGWTRGHDFVSSAADESVYFVLFDWERPPQATLIRRTLAGAEELAKVAVPEELFEAAVREDGRRPGGTVHRLGRSLEEWLRASLEGGAVGAPAPAGLPPRV
ncbi:MAG: hypothetical protein M0017_13215 [Desulfobacteraceae bacterium]|nr:hypothetical protein [Desulfobacteraceae bacterium]